MQARYRTDYAGEFVILETRWTGGKKTENREWIANPIENHHLSGRAACIGSDLDRWQFDHRRLQRHRGGLLGSKKLQTYGTGAISQHMRLDFTVETNPDMLAEILHRDYQTKNIVYTSPRHCIAHPGEFYLIPHRPRILDTATAIYLAAFDGHKEIFLLGYNDEMPAEHNEWTQQITGIFQAYSGTKFYTIGQGSRMPDAWLDCANVQHMSYRDWIGYCDV
jgi:hypothetical protein